MPELNGLVLCGGESLRMGQPKALLEYHNQPQFLYVAGLLQHFCQQVFISVNMAVGDFHDYTIIADAEKYKNAGPISGVLSTIEQYPETSLLVAACDYPYLQQSDLSQLFREPSDHYDAVCFMHPESQLAEPLIAIYHQSCFKKMKDWFIDGGQSLRKFLEQINTRFISPGNPLFLKSHDTPEDFLTFTTK